MTRVDCATLLSMGDWYFLPKKTCYHYLPLSGQQQKDLALPGAIQIGWAYGHPPLVLDTQGKCIICDPDQTESYS